MAIEDALISIKQGLELIGSTIADGLVNFIGVTTGVWIPSWGLSLILIFLILGLFWKWLHRMGLLIVGLTLIVLASLFMHLFGSI